MTRRQVSRVKDQARLPGMGMAEVIMVYDTPVLDDGRRYDARVVGREADDGMWEGWIEFLPAEADAPLLVTGVESRQPAREHLVYWSTGLTSVYLEGALARARNPRSVRTDTIETPATDEPLPRMSPARPPLTTPEPILDPFEIGARSLDILRQELTALNRPRLLNIIAAFDLNPGGEEIGWMTDRQLVHFICVAVETQMTR